jgi:uncharacterized protein (DUF488 family)
MTETIFTIGHSTRSIDEFIHLLRVHGVQAVVDVRTIARSRHNPQFAEPELAASLGEQNLRYQRLESLGGLRHSSAALASVNGAWRNASFRSYADYMQTAAFDAGVDELIALGEEEQAVIMCAEAVPWRCHRSLIGDALLVRGIEVLDIMNEKDARVHAMTRFARVDGLRVTYPPEDDVTMAEAAQSEPTGTAARTKRTTE